MQAELFAFVDWAAERLKKQKSSREIFCFNGSMNALVILIIIF
jgi:hypothetical protein